MQDRQRIRERLTYANVMSTLAVFLVLSGGAAYAASNLGKNSVGSKQLRKSAVTAAKIKKGAVTAVKLRDGSITAAKVADRTLTGTQINSSTLGTVPAATRAESASRADSATSADHASSADDAARFGGVVPVPPATPIELLNGWVPYGEAYDQPAYWVDANGVVNLKGSVKQPVPASDVIFILPVGLRPARSTNWPATLDQARFGTIEIEADGRVRARTFTPEQATRSQAFTSMEGVSFRPTDP
jgi:hypothetical protein